MKKLEWVAVVLLLGIAFGIRVLPIMHLVIGTNINFYSVDDYYYLHLMDNILSNQLADIDMLRNFPSGEAVARLPYAYFLSFFPQLLNFLNPDMVIIWIPPILLVISLISIYILSRKTFGTGPSLIGLTILSVIPGEFLARTALASIDQHCMEICLSSLLMLFAFLSFDSTGKITKVILSIITGLVLGVFMLIWEGTLLFVLILITATVTSWFMHKDKSFYIQLCISCIVAVAISKDFTIAIVAMVMPVLYIMRNLPLVHKIWISITGATVAGLLGWLVFPAYFNSMISNFNNIFIWHMKSATAEEAPLLVQNNEFDLKGVWQYFTGAFYLFVAAIGSLIFLIKKYKDPKYILVLSWGIILLLATLSMRRFAYYLAIPISITVGYFFWIASKALVYDTVRTTRKIIIKRVSWGTILLMTAVISMLILVPSMQMTADMKNSVLGGAISPGWREALNWVNVQTPNTKDYGILSWWDYGYWITRETGRPVYCDPGGGNRRYAGWLLSSSNLPEIQDSIKAMKVRYIVIDYLMATSKNYSIVQHAAEKAVDFQEPSRMYYDRRKGTFSQALLYYPNYYNQLMTKLYNFNTMPVKAKGCPVFRYEDHNGYLEIIDIKDMPDYNAAIQYINQQPKETYSKYIIAGTDPFNSPVNIAELNGFKLVFTSRSSIKVDDNLVIPEVKIFEVIQ